MPADRGQTPEKIEVIKSGLIKALTVRVQAACIFGSVATGNYRPDSDVDLVLVAKTEGTGFIKRPLLFSDLHDIHPEMDILVYTPEEFARQTTPEGQRKNPFWRIFMQQALRIL